MKKTSLFLLMIMFVQALAFGQSDKKKYKHLPDGFAAFSILPSARPTKLATVNGAF